MIPARFAPILFGFIPSGLMSCIVSGIATARALGLDGQVPAHWGAAWLTSWAVAFATVLVVAPLARRLGAALTAPARP